MTTGIHPPLGTIAVSGGNDLFLVVVELCLVLAQWPWVIPCIAVTPRQRQHEKFFDLLLPELRGRLAVVHVTGIARLATSAIIAAVRNRPLPTANILAELVAHRIRVPSSLPYLLAQFEEALDGVPATDRFSDATFSRRFRALGAYRARHWRALAQLCRAVSEEVSTDNEVHAGRRIKGPIRKALTIPPRTAMTPYGWEWMLERALRLGGYV